MVEIIRNLKKLSQDMSHDESLDPKYADAIDSVFDKVMDVNEELLELAI